VIPELLNARGVRAFGRLKAKLVADGRWLALIDDLHGTVTAAEVGRYVAMVQASPDRRPPAVVIEQTRRMARKLLVSMLWLPAARENLAPLTLDGLDADLLALAAEDDPPRPTQTSLHPRGAYA
jgi:hypothetical protein